MVVMEVWREQLEQMLDQVAEYAEDWDWLMNDLAAKPETKQLHEYLTFLVPRLKTMQRRINRVEYDAELKTWDIYNYSFDMFRYIKSRYPDATITPGRIVLRNEEITPEDRDKLLAER